MPNWCSNILIVSGEKKDLKAFEEYIKDDECKFSFNKIKPVPKELNNTPSPAPKEVAKKNRKKYGYEDWYHFCIDEWGTKWAIDPDTLKIKKFSTNLCYTFQTAWTPPLQIYSILAKKFTELKFLYQYYEPGCRLAGDGVLDNNNYKPVQNDNKYYEIEARFKKLDL